LITSGASVLLLCLAQALVATEFAPAPAVTARERNKAAATELQARHARELGGQGNILVRPGLLADRTNHKVILYAESIRLAPGTPVEFALISEESGKDYEALAVAFAKPSDVHAALTFIGIAPGRGIDASRLRFWPKGERARVVFRYRDTGDHGNLERSVPAEQLVIDTRTAKALPETGFVFTGSDQVTIPGQSNAPAYAADVFSPNSIVSFYNEPGTVLDVPRRAAQQDVYSFQVPNPEQPLPEAQLIQIELVPERPGGQARVHEPILRIVAGTNGASAPFAPIFTLAKSGEVPSNTITSAELVHHVNQLVRYQIDPYVTILPDDSLALSALRAAASLIDSLENEQGLRVEPPPSGHPYYKAFLPNERHRSREGRPIQPWELYLGEDNGNVTGGLIRVEEDWKGADTQPTYSDTHTAVACAHALAGALAQKEAPTVVLVFAPPDLTYGRFRAFAAPILERNMILYVFLPPPGAAPPKAQQP
jgi:hypothetical protein